MFPDLFYQSAQSSLYNMISSDVEIPQDLRFLVFNRFKAVLATKFSVNYGGDVIIAFLILGRSEPVLNIH